MKDKKTKSKRINRKYPRKTSKKTRKKSIVKKPSVKTIGKKKNRRI